MKYSDIRYYLDKDNFSLNEINYISLDKKLFWDIAENVCDSYFEVYDKFIHENIKFTLREYNSHGHNYMIIYLKNKNMGYGYEVLSTNERIIKGLLE